MSTPALSELSTTVPRNRVPWRPVLGVVVWVPSAIAGLMLPAALLLTILWVIPAPQHGDFLARITGQELGSEVHFSSIYLVAVATVVLWVLLSFAISRIGGEGVVYPWRYVFTGPMRWWHSVLARFATIPLAVIGTILLLFWFVGALITTASRDGWGNWLFLAMFIPVLLVATAAGTGLFTQWGGNQYGSYVVSIGSIWLIVLFPIVLLWAAVGLIMALLPIAPAVLVAGSPAGSGIAAFFANIPLESPWAAFAIQPFPVYWVLGASLGFLYWLPASLSWLLEGDTLVRGEGVSPRAVLFDAMRVVYTFPIGPR